MVPAVKAQLWELLFFIKRIKNMSFNIKTGFHLPEWQYIRQPETITKDRYYKMRVMQRGAYEKLKGKQYSIINSPPGSGKSTAVEFLGVDHLENNPTLKIIIIVPQTQIGSSFRDCNLQFEDGKRIQWKIGNDYCLGNKNGISKSIVSFMINPAPKSSIMSRVLLTTHQSFVFAYKKCPSVFNNFLLVIDEAHRIQTDEESNIEDRIFENEMGKIVARFLDDEKSDVRLLLTTATYFRGNKMAIIPHRHIGKFVKYLVPYHEYLRTCKHLRYLGIDFIEYNDRDYSSALKWLFSLKGIGKAIVYIPPVGSSCSVSKKKNGKHDDVEEVYRALSGKNNPEKRELENGVTEVRRGNKWIKTNNLVDEKNRENKKRYIEKTDENLTNGRDMLDVIITLNMFKEGANWKWADREILLSIKNSHNANVQIIGRLLRDAPGKKSVMVYQFINARLSLANPSDRLKNINDYLKIIMSLLQLEELFSPKTIQKTIKLPNSINGKRKSINNGQDELSDYPEDLITPDEEHKIFLRVFMALTQIKNDYVVKSDILSKIQEIVKKDFVKIGVDIKYCSVVSNKIYDCLEKKAKDCFDTLDAKINGVHIGDVIKKDLVKEKFSANPVLSILRHYVSDMCGSTLMCYIRNAISKCKNIERADLIDTAMYTRDWAKTEQVNGFNVRTKWNEHCNSGKKPKDIPDVPEKAYSDGEWVEYVKMDKEGNFDQYLNIIKERKNERQLRVFNEKHNV
jgi:superfamily II DNA or RNA helicase